ncbi:GAP family protein [Phytoactinopolyspora mesophila]|uniref:GAP family protein n=1 Tax=Phytoactinopolyspora mesophila TaxID=2650750 RepID=A0A7K3M5P4_9ACTN|nr:GAP family protein [Phytoactinopolyspora mesophila]NDL58565.1 GAP family protein [Phytoactinopolyspora mesophila]
MSGGLVAALAGLSLIDSTSFGTLLIPIWLLLAPGRIRPSRIAAYLGTVAAFYFVIGLALAAGADAALQAGQNALGSIPETPLRLAQLVLGLAIIALSYWLEARIKQRGDSPGRLQSWRSKAITENRQGGTGTLTKLAVTATSIEVATMLPYLVAIGLLTAADLSPAAYGTALAGYCLLMIMPAVVLTVVRIAWHSKAEATLTKINAWFTRHNAKAVGWTVGGIGIGLSVNAIINLLVA